MKMVLLLVLVAGLTACSDTGSRSGGRLTATLPVDATLTFE